MYNKLYTKFIACLALLLAMPMTWALASPPDDEPAQPTLQELLDSYTFGPDDYSWGPGPGVISDSTTYADWYNLYSSALQMSSSTTATDEEKAAMVVKLQAMKQKVDAAIKPVTDGVYYIITTFSAFNGKDTMAWFAPREHNFPGWKKLDKNSLKFMWRITKLEDGNYSMQNLATLQYVFHNTTIDGQETNMYMTDDMEYEQVLENIKPNGQFLIHCKGANWTYNIQKHNSGNATEGPIGNWLDKNLNGEGTWRLQPVTESELAAASATQYHQMLEARVNSFNADSYTLGTDPGNYSQEAMDAVKAEITADTTLLANTESPATEEQCKAAYEKMLSLGGAHRGDKTMLDTLIPFGEALDAAAKEGKSLKDAWTEAAAVAQKAAEDTANMVPKVGRARPAAERSLGTPDAGAVSMALCIRVVAGA